MGTLTPTRRVSDYADVLLTGGVSDETPTYIGLSLSLCVRDMLLGKVPKERVLAIVSGCAGPLGVLDVEDILYDDAFAYYRDNYWDKWALNEISDVLRGIVVTTRRRGVSMNIGHGHWIVQYGSKSIQAKL
jgi:hypothetical protein